MNTNAFLDVRLPINEIYGTTATISFLTSKSITRSGHEKMNAEWKHPKRSYQISYIVQKDSDIYKDILGIYLVVQGDAMGFRYRDLEDYQSIGQKIAIGDGIKTNFQIVKHYSTSNVEHFYTRALTKIVSDVDAIKLGVRGQSYIPFGVFIDGKLQTEGVDYTVDRGSGIIIFTMPPNNDAIIIVDCEFDVPTKFIGDSLVVNYDVGMKTYNISLNLVEMRQ